MAERENSIIGISLPFKDQVSANAVRRHLRDLKYSIGPTVQPFFVSRKLEQDFRPKEVKPSVVNQRRVIISRTICAMQIMLVTQPDTFSNALPKNKCSAIGKHLTEAHGGSDLLNESSFKVLKKCQSKFDCLVFEMLYINKCKRNSNLASAIHDQV